MRAPTELHRPGAPAGLPRSKPARLPDGRVLPFRRRSGLPVRRRRRLLGVVRQFAAALALVGTPAAALWWSATSPRFALGRMEIETTERVNRAWVEERLAHLRGRNLVWMSMKSVERSLRDHPWIGGVELSKSLPDRLRVAVVERRPVAVLEAADGRFHVDREGRVIAPLDAEGEPPGEAGRAGGRLVLRESPPSGGEAGSGPAWEREAVLRRALEAATALSRVDPGWGGALTEVEILGEEDLVLRTRELPFPLLVEAGAVEQRVRTFAGMLPELLARVPEPGRVDLRFENRMVIRER
ncbi:MAG TPA: FtsQ-type POTRA domain-containing protein [Thermoanaerobaculia bacterium]|nr:FtsQ-type POTRA domain-containing protein [Thermoanaerobaculia bacterium]